jgi:N-acyl-D-amino-acid deacylase
MRSVPDLRGRPDPRLFGTFPRILARCVRERGVLTLEEAVRRMTSLPAETFGLVERGSCHPGVARRARAARSANVADTATYDDPKRHPDGIRLVVVNGAVAYDDARHTGVGARRRLRHRRP